MTNFLYLVVGHLFYKVLALVMFALLARYLGSEDFGRYALALAAVLLADLVADMGISQVIVRESAGRSLLLATDLVAVAPVKLALGLASIGLALGAVATFGADPKLIEITFYLALSQALSSLTLTLRAVFQAYERMEYEALSVSLEGWIRLAAILYAIGASLGVLGIVKGFALASFVVFAATLVIVLHRFVRPLLASLDWSRAGRLLVMGVPFSLVWLMFGADQRLNTLLLGRISGESAAGMYSAAMRLIEPTLIVPTMLTAALFPVVVRHDRAGLSTLRVLLTASQKALLMIGLALSIGVGLLAPELVRALFGPEFDGAIVPLRVGAAAIVLLFVRIGLTQILLAAANWRGALITQVSGIVVNVAFAVVAIPVAGPAGAALAFLVGQSTAVGAASYFLRRDIDRMVLGELSRPIVVGIISTIAGLAFLQFGPATAGIAAALMFILASRVVRVFTVADTRYMRTTFAPLGAVAAFAGAEDR